MTKVYVASPVRPVWEAEKACQRYLSQEDKWLKKIKRQTNIQEF